VLGLIACRGAAGLSEFADGYLDADVVALRERVTMELDAEVDAAYPKRWIGRVTVETHDGRTLCGRVDEPKGDPGNSLDRAEIEAKALRLAAFSGAATAEEMRGLFARVWTLSQAREVGPLLAAAT